MEKDVVFNNTFKKDTNKRDIKDIYYPYLFFIFTDI